MNLAEQYANSVMDEILANDRNGTPYGVADDGHCVDSVMSASDYLEDALDLQYIIGTHRDYRGARVLLTLGGPNVWANTIDQELVVTWGTDTARRALPDAYVQGIDDAAYGLWSAGE